MECCPPPDPNGLNGLFRGRYVDHEVRRLLRGGLERRQAYMLARLAPADARVLDLGAGVGGIGLTALREGARSAVLVEVSRDSLDAARGLADRFGVADRATFLLADAATLPSEVEADAVVLDRVVCCYPDAEALLGRAAAASGRALVFSYPVPTWWMRLGRSLANAAMRLLRREYRFFVHDPEALRRAAGSAGHRLVEERRFGPWRVAVLAADPASRRGAGASGPAPRRGAAGTLDARRGTPRREATPSCGSSTRGSGGI